VPNGENWQPADPEVARLRDNMIAVRYTLNQRIEALEHRMEAAWQTEATSKTERKTRTWQAILALVTGLVLPLGVLGILALIHLLAR
jgi:hypothetical protein